MIEVKVRKNNVDRALQILKQKVKNSGLLVELQEREYYKKPSEKRREHKLRGILREKYRQLDLKNEGKI